MADPKKITLHTIISDDPWKTEVEWVFTLEGDKVKAEAKQDRPFVPSVVNEKGEPLGPGDGREFWKALQNLPYSRAIWVQFDDEPPKP